MASATIIYWTRLALALLTALLVHRLRLDGLEGISLAAGIYLASCAWVKYGHSNADLGGKYKYLTIAVGTYVFVWAASWVFLFTLWRY